MLWKIYRNGIIQVQPPFFAILDLLNILNQNKAQLVHGDLPNDLRHSKHLGHVTVELFLLRAAFFTGCSTLPARISQWTRGTILGHD